MFLIKSRYLGNCEVLPRPRRGPGRSLFQLLRIVAIFKGTCIENKENLAKSPNS